MQKTIKYTIFRTKWGYFGLVGTECTLWRTCLPLSEPEKVKSELLDAGYLIPDTRFAPASAFAETSQASRIELDKNFFKTLQEQIITYFEGACISFSRDIPVALDGFSLFSRSVLKACMDVKFGEKVTYSALAKELGRPGAARAAGNVLAQNPLPLIIPCHRVIRNDGAIGGFTSPGGVKLKKKLLMHEKNSTSR